MGLRFHKSISICKGIKLNVSKSGVGVSLGTKGLHYSLNSSGRRSATLSLPGTGLSYSKTFATGKKKSTKTTSAAKAKSEELKKQKEAMKQQASTELEENRLKVEEAENYLDVIRSVHKECEEMMDWEEIENAPPPFVKGSKGPNEQEAQKALDEYRPGLGAKLFGDKKRAELEKAVEDAKKADEELFEAWQESIKSAQRIKEGDIDSYLEIIREANPFEDLVEYGSGFEFGTDDPRFIETEFTVKSDEVVPKKRLTLLKSGKLSEKDMTKTEYFDIEQDYVCSCAIRIAREIFAILPVEAVIVHAQDAVLDTATGNDREETILSVLFEREKFRGINFDRIDPSDFVNTFECNMHFTKTGGFKPVSRLGE